ncbi:MAG TPA: DUF503 domain-containing protein [Acidobacteriota bacterium]|nr:DUF503 domain-containing protein [Acidobacteriota bacterium]
MPILFCSLELYLPYCHSLKEKRRIVRKAADRLRSRFNFSISEIDHQDTWQRSRMAAVAVGPNRIVLERLSEKFIRESERILGGDLVDYYIEFFEHD